MLHCPSSAKSFTLCQTAFRRLPGTPQQDLGPLINVSEFKKPVYSIYVTSLVINNLGLSTVCTSHIKGRLFAHSQYRLYYPQVITYITDTAVGAGINVTLSYDLVAIVNAMCVLGQLAGGFLADRYGNCSSTFVAPAYGNSRNSRIRRSVERPRLLNVIDSGCHLYLAIRDQRRLIRRGRRTRRVRHQFSPASS